MKNKALNYHNDNILAGWESGDLPYPAGRASLALPETHGNKITK
jgi:hypothetical protein